MFVPGGMEMIPCTAEGEKEEEREKNKGGKISFMAQNHFVSLSLSFAGNR